MAVLGLWPNCTNFVDWQKPIMTLLEIAGHVTAPLGRGPDKFDVAILGDNLSILALKDGTDFFYFLYL